MATLAAARQDMEGFVQGLFQGSPDLSILTHAIVRKKYLAHVGKEALTKEEKDQLKRLIEKELLQLQIEDSGDEELLTILKPSAEPGGQKRAFCPSDSSEDEVESKRERKKRRTGKGLKLSSDEEDSGIDSKKAQACRGPEHAGKSSSSSDHGDSGAEGHASGSEEENGKDDTAPPSRRTNRETPGSPSSKRPQGRGRGERAGSEGEESGGGLGSDVQEEAGKLRKATKLQIEESENKSECKLQKKKEMDRDEKKPGRMEKRECIRDDKQRRKRDTESEDESYLSEIRGRKRTDWRESGKERAGGDGHQAKTMGGPRGRKAQERSLSEDESDCAPQEKQKTQRKVAGYKHQKKGWSMEKSESDSDDIGSKGPRMKGVCKTKFRRASAEKLKTDSDSEEKEVLAKKVGNQGTKKAQGKGAGRKAPGGNHAHRNPVKQQGGPKPKRGVSQKESGSEADEEKDLAQKKKGPWDSSSSENESQSGAEQRGKVKKPSEKSTVSGDDSESSSEETASVTQRQKRLSEERKVKKEVFGSDSSEEEEEPIKKGVEKPQRERVSEAETVSDSEDSSSESSGKAKSRQEKRPQKLKGRSTSREETRSDSSKEEQPGSSGDEDGPRSSRKQHQGKDKEHRSAKGEDHPAVQRLKRYIRECGARRNYKKLLMGCRSRKAQLEVLKQELENLGLKGTPSLAKCKALKKKLEEAAEVASLDLSNIITTEGRPRRRNVWSLYGKPGEQPHSPEEPPPCRRAADWSRLRGVISSDDESD
ncbi:HIRA-interacting protein 3 [Paroedura picta]|uniref:HIRA-interacting protein 3 n=1 Tax=Paroedura picta TaxID=143630 RepID=UPI0040568DD6